jgi:hypothetical protein
MILRASLTGSMLLILGVLLRSLVNTAVNRRILAILLLAFVAQMTMGIGLWTVGVSSEIVHWLQMVVSAVTLGSLTINTERALFPSLVATLAGFLFIAWNFPWLYFTMSAVNAVILLNIIKVWAPRRRSTAVAPPVS